MAVVGMPDGRSVYFKREVGWMNHDIWVISPSSDLCQIPNPKTDYRFKELGGPQTIPYKIDGNRLILVLTGPRPDPPEGGPFPVDIVWNEVHTVDFREIERDPAKLGLTVLRLPIDQSLKCRP
jgi:hypothetical protein